MNFLSNPIVLLYRLFTCRSEQVLVFLLRGGLGNQLHQIAAASYFSRTRKVQIIFYDHDLKYNARDGGTSRFLNLNLDKWFLYASHPPYVSRGILYFIIRSAVSLSRRFGFPKVFHEDELRSRTDYPRFMLVQDYFMNKKYVEDLDSSQIIDGLSLRRSERNLFPAQAESAIHLRLTDYNLVDSSPLDYKYYERSLKILGIQTDAKVDIYSDDLVEARSKLQTLALKNAVYPEISQPLSPEEFLIRISSYSSIIASRSSLCWWGCLLATLKDSRTKVVCPWPKENSLDNWLHA